jgi:topoisomerase IA-like protein
LYEALVKKYQDNLITDYSILKNYYKADALNHFLVAVYQGQELISDYLQIETFENGLEQSEIEHRTEDESAELDKEKTIKLFEEDSDLQVLNGRYGPYIKYQNSNYKIPKTTDPKKLTLEECKRIIEDSAKDKKSKSKKTKKSESAESSTTKKGTSKTADKGKTKTAKATSTKKTTGKRSTKK